MTPESRDVAGLDVTVILPVHNEAGHLRAEVDRIEAAVAASPYSFEIIVIDDGSTDGSLDELGDLAGSETVKVIRFAENRGSGSAARRGHAPPRVAVVVWTDADMTYPNDQIPALVKELDGYDQVVGVRTSEQGTHRAARVPAKWFIRKLASFLVERPIPDLNSGFRAFGAKWVCSTCRSCLPGSAVSRRSR